MKGIYPEKTDVNKNEENNKNDISKLNYSLNKNLWNDSTPWDNTKIDAEKIPFNVNKS